MNNNTRTRTFHGVRRFPNGKFTSLLESVYRFEPRRTRSIFVKTNHTNQPQLISVETAPLVIGIQRWDARTSPTGWGPPIIYFVRAEQTDAEFDIRTTWGQVFSPGLCVGDEAQELLRLGKISASEAVWMTAWSRSMIHLLSARSADEDENMGVCSRSMYASEIEWTELKRG